MPRPGIEPGPLDLQSTALPTELSRLDENTFEMYKVIFVRYEMYKFTGIEASLRH